MQPGLQQEVSALLDQRLAAHAFFNIEPNVLGPVLLTT
jgi:hypothetical protein